MKTNNISLVSWIALWMLAIVTISWVSAYKWDPSVQWPDYTVERHEEMEDAFENSDFEAWSALMEWKGRVTEVVNAENFENFVEAHELAENGDIEWANEIKAELGLGLKDGANKWMWKGMNKWNKSWARNGTGERWGTSDCQYTD